MKKAVLIDVSAVMYRAYYSLMNIRNSKREPTGAVLGFANTLLKILDTFNPDYIAAAFDVRKETLKRKEIYAEYKENREAMPEDLAVQIKYIEELLDNFNIKKYKINGYEADDVLGTLARKMEAENVEVYIVTGDKDLSQVLSDKIKIALPGKTTDEKFRILATDDDVVEQLGVTPEKIPDLFGLQGDSSDGIPGVRGVGPKTAVKLIGEYVTLENLYENIEKISGKLKEKLIEDREMAFLSRKLAVIDVNVPIENYNISENELAIPQNEKLLDFFNRMEFKSLIKKMALEEKKKSNGLFEKSTEAEEERKTEKEVFNINIVSDEADMVQLLLCRELAVYVTEGGAAFSNGKETWYVPTSHGYLGAVNIDNSYIENILKDESKKIYGFNLKKIIRERYGISNPYFDIMIAYYLLNSDERFTLERLISQVRGEDLEDYKAKFGKTEERKITIENMAYFAGKRAWHLFYCKGILENKLAEEELSDVFFNIEMKLMPVLANVEKNGIKIDPAYFYKYSEELDMKIRKLEDRIYQEAGANFNISSPKQLSEILFDKMRIMPEKKTKTGFSTDVEVLESLAEQNIPIAEMILEYRQFVKLKTTYVDALPKAIDKNNRIHTTYNQEGTATGRLSSTDPNLQNIPVKTDEGIKIRKGFIAEKGYTLMACDYSQIELRVLGEITGDPELVRAYTEGIDLHALTASKIFGRDINDISREERIAAKIVNFSILYGKTPFGLAKEIKITQSDAKEYIERYFVQYKGVADFIAQTISAAEESGKVHTYFGRKRTIEGIASSNKNIKHGAERMAVNTVIQGTAADILKIVMIKMDEAIKNLDGIKMILQVHDELVFEIKNEYVEKYEKIIKDIMENSIDFKKVKLEVKCSSALSWDETK